MLACLLCLASLGVAGCDDLSGYSGTFSGDKGSGDISGGIFNKPALQFTISTQGDGEASDWIFRGTITDDTIEGTVSTSLGAFPFTGSRPQ